MKPDTNHLSAAGRPTANPLARWDIRQRQLLIVAAPFAGRKAMLALAARIALHNPLRVLDGGNRFNAYVVAQELRRLRRRNPAEALARIRVARAFTCHQVLALLTATPPEPVPTLAIDILDTFYDESVPLDERLQLARQTAARLRLLSRHAAVIVSVRPPPPPHIDPTGLLDVLQDAADTAWMLELPAPQEQPRLF